jgi:RNA polymerase primary sigma factor
MVNKYNPLSPEAESEVMRRAKKGDINAQQKLINCNLRFVISVAKQYASNPETLLELIQEGNTGLIYAIERFDETRGFKFISYAVWHIRQRIQNFLISTNKSVRLPSHKAKDITKVNEFVNKYYAENGIIPSSYVLEDMIEVKSSVHERPLIVESYNSPMSCEDSKEKVAGMEYKQELQDRELERQDDQKLVRFMLSKLTNKERFILLKFFGLDGEPDSRSMASIATELGLTKERVRQIKEVALKKLRNMKNNEAEVTEDSSNI